MKRTLRWVALGTIAMLVVVALASTLALVTPLGTWAVNRLGLPGALPSGVTVEGLSGRLAGDLQLSRLRVVGDGFAVEVRDGEVEFSPWGLLLPPRSLRIERIAAAEVVVEQTPTQASKPPAQSGPIPLGAPQLPMSVLVDDVDVDLVEVSTASGWAATITALRAAGAWRPEGASVEGLRFAAQVRAPEGDGAIASFEARGKALWPSDSGQASEALLTLAGETAGLPALEITAGLQGALAGQPTLSLTSAAPLAAVLEGRVRGLKNPSTMAGDARLTLPEAIDLALLHEKLPPITLTGTLAAALEDQTLSAQPRLTIGLEAFDVIAPDRRTAMVEGLVTVRTAGTAPATLGVEELAVSLGNPEAPSGRISVKGTATAEPSVDASVRIDGLDPAWVAPQWNGRLEGDIALVAALQDGAALPNIELREFIVQGELREQPVVLQGKGSFNDEGRLTIDGLTGRSGEATLDVDGALTLLPSTGWLPSAATLEAALEVPDLEEVMPYGSGSLSGQATLQGDLDNPVVVASVSAQALALDGNIALDSASADIDVQGRDALSVDVSAQRLQLAGTSLARVTAGAEGSLDQHELTLSIVNPEGTLRTAVSAEADIDGRRWVGTLREFSLNALDREWRLAAGGDQSPTAEPPRLLISTQEQSLSPLCVAAPPHSDRLCVNGKAEGEVLDAQLTLESVALQPWTSLLALPIRIDASLAGDLRAQRTAQDALPTVAGGVRLSPGELTLSPIDQEEVGERALRWDQLSVEIDTVEESLIASATADLTDAGRVDAQARLPRALLGSGFEPSAHEVEASVRGALEIPERLADAIPGVTDLSGRATVDLSANGALNAPRLLGSVEVREVEADIAQAGLHVQDGELTLRAEDNTLSVRARAGTGEGVLQTQATFERDDTAWRGAFSLDGERVLLMDTPQVRAFITPSLRARVDSAAQTIELDGSVLVPEARLRPIDLSNAVRTSNDEVIVGQAAAETDDGWRTSADLTLALGEDVSYRGGGFTGFLRGELAVRERPGEVTTGNGELSVADARFSVFGQTLEVNRGRVVFIRSPLTNPGLDVQASRSVDDVTVRVDVRGTLRDQVITVSSTPALPQADALSYLVVGKPVSELQGGGDSELLASAARQGGLAGADLLARRVGRRIGLDDFGVEQEQGGENAQLVVGKYLSPRLYVRYGLGLFETLNTWLLRYDLSRRWAVETQTGAQNSVDVLYSIEN
ncbi:MAG: translocation/assembly module TamB domain-containing protein [Pseudomonadota bacterium]